MSRTVEVEFRDEAHETDAWLGLSALFCVHGEHLPEPQADAVVWLSQQLANTGGGEA